MKEIDFLPSWYKSDRRQQISYRTQYITLGGVFVAMLLSNFVATISISRATKKLVEDEQNAQTATAISQEFNNLKTTVTELEKKVKILETIDSKIDVASVLGELSFLIDKKIVLNKVELAAEKLADSPLEHAGTGSVIKTIGPNFTGKKRPPLGDVRFRVVLSGVAADASEVAELTCRLEESAYFRHVYPSFSRSVMIEAAGNTVKEHLQATEFEISCYLANYEQAGVALAKEQKSRSWWRKGAL
ncbi:MAG: hypothetical protein JSW23_01030 [Planctomycetota bacterium]|nr:MAG: hypothetical protein JSW23_01030 [Planctomycetota bacterium]